MAVRGTADRLVPMRATVGRRGLDVESRRWDNAAAGHHGRFCEYTLLSLMLASEWVKRNKKSQFQRLNSAKGQPGGLVWIQAFVARCNASGWIVWACVKRGGRTEW